MERFIRDRLQDTKTLQHNLDGGFGVRYDLVMYLFKGKEPVYYSFLTDCPYTAICNSLDYSGCMETTSEIIRRNKGKIERRKPIEKQQKIEPNLVKRNWERIPTFMLIKILNNKL